MVADGVTTAMAVSILFDAVIQSCLSDYDGVDASIDASGAGTFDRNGLNAGGTEGCGNRNNNP